MFSVRRCFLFLFLGAALALHMASAQGEYGRRDLQRKILLDILNASTYDAHLTPGTDSSAVKVSVQIYVRDIFEVDDHNNEMSVQLTLRQYWNDPRLKYTGRNDLKYVTVHDLTQIWRPDVFITNSKEENTHGYTRPNAFARIYSNGDIRISERLSFTVVCKMDLSHHPFDTQSCPIRMSSYGYSEDDVSLVWKEDNPFQIKTELSLPHFSLNSFEASPCNAATTATGTYSCVLATFTFSRNAKYYFSQVFIPCTMFVIIGYLVFWLEPSNLMARLAISLSTLYVATSQVSQLNSDLPKAPYKVLDSFTGICLTFIFTTVLETVIVYNLAKREKSESRGRRGGGGLDDQDTEILDGDEERNGFQLRANAFSRRNVRDYLAAIPKMSDKIDIIFVAGYPLVFLVFVLVYFFSVAV